MHDMKTCFKCSQSLPTDCFYKHPKMRDGLLGKCKECAKKDVKSGRDARREQYSEYDHQRFKKAGRKFITRLSQIRSRERNPEKQKARNKTDYAVRSGKLIKKSCEVCGNVKSQAHHSDYSKPLDVRWLCFKHHRETHGQTVVSKHI